VGNEAAGPDRGLARNWEHFIMFLRFSPEIRKIVYTTNMIEPLNARFRRATRRRGHIPDKDAALKVLYLVIRDRRPNRHNATGRTRDWKEAINTLAGFYGERVTDHH
jgi:putative transposase